MTITRRDFVKGALGTGAALALGGCGDSGESASNNSISGGADTGVGAGGMDTGQGGPTVCKDPFADGTLLGDVPLLREPDDQSVFHEVYNQGHDGRLLTDLSVIEPGVDTISNDHFYIRTLYPDQLDHQPGDPWAIRLHGLVEQEQTVLLSELEPFIEPMGTFVLECSGNSRYGSYGLMSAASWEGIPIGRLLERATPTASAVGVEISGFDRHSAVSTHSTPGASWIYTLDQLEASGAFLATHMNGEPLPLDHGFPVRLYAPNWYGCCCIKWLDAVRFIDNNEPATAQMREFARRTHQPGSEEAPPDAAADYKPATMDQSAMPVRIEQWEVDGEQVMRVIGIMWGGYTLTDALTIRFNPDQDWVPVDVCPPQHDNLGWTVWTHAWRPSAPGTYRIRCHIDDPNIPTYRLDRGYYDRNVRV
ncbi:MAG: molybdopterin-dependent oxidoreductase [Myxococcota bacterium]